MKLYSLSDHPNRPCLLLKYSSATVMLDCGLDVSTLLSFLPIPLTQSGRFAKLPGWAPREVPASLKLEEELKECGGKIFVDSEPELAAPEFSMVDMSEVDVILISNYHCMLALPYLTEYTNFRGTVYATEPTLHIGKLYMEEMAEYIERVPKLKKASKWKSANVLCHLPFPLRDLASPKTWRRCFNKHDIRACLTKVQKVGFNEKKDIFGALEVTPISSGFAIGSCNWVIKSDYEKMAYVSGSSTLTTHPKPMEQSPLRNCDILIMAALTQTPTANPDAMIGEFCVNTAVTLKNGGNVLVPCYPSGVTYDLFECLSGHLESIGLGQVPLYFISPVADSSLAYSNIYAEWLSAGKQSKVYLPEPPFPHAELIKCNRLKHFSSLHEGFNKELRTPCVTFVGHPSLRFGDVVHLLQLWGKSSTNSIIFTEPDFPYLEALAPYQPLAMKVSHCPIDTSLSFSQANKLIKELKPLHLVVPNDYLTPPVLLQHRPDLIVDYDPTPVSYRQAQVLTLPIKRRFEKLELDQELASKLMPTEVKPGVAVAMVTGSLLSRDNKHLLEPLDATDGPSKKKKKPFGIDKKRPTYVWGSLDVTDFVKNLKEQDITDVKVEDCAGGHIVHLPSEDTLIQIEDGSTHIICQGNEPLRIKLRDTLLKCLAQF